MMKPKTKQEIRIVNRTVYCFKCSGNKEIASYYCPCGTFLCALHIIDHKCLLTEAVEYSEALRSALA